ncbi:helicase associated domain-containing protein, partial [Kitasatospora sp. NPDC093558]|uniref:helicase associated domain-containing protein n=1 Tax=Kitasatospora sp. NPDC093558 TaxID=3155201 RepID=UPI00343D60E6
LADWLDQQIDLMPDLHPDQRNLLGALPFDHPMALLLRRPRSPGERAFAEGLRAARTFRREHQHLDVPYDYVAEQAGRRFRLGEWISRQRRDAAQLTRGQLDALQALHMRWIPRQKTPAR